METQAHITSSAPAREPWNKGKLIGQKPPLRPKHVWSIRTRLQMEGRTRDLAIFNLAIDSKLRVLHGEQDEKRASIRMSTASGGVTKGKA